MKTNLFFWLLLFFVIVSLDNKIIAQSNNDLQTLAVQEDSLFNCFILYSRPYDELLFKTSGNEYSATATLTLEVYENSRNVFRDEITKTVTEADYKETKNRRKEVAFLFKFQLPEGKYLTKASLFLNSNSKISDFQIDTFQLVKNSVSPESILTSSNCNDNRNEVISVGYRIPFSNEPKNLLAFFPHNSDYDKLVVKQFSIVSAELAPKKMNFGKFNIVDTSNIVIANSDNSQGKGEVSCFENPFAKLIPGKATLIFKGENKTASIKVDIVWKDKPAIFQDWEKTLEVMSYIFPVESLTKLNSAPPYLRLKYLFDFWKKYDDDKSTAYNPLMIEFFKRVDFAENNFTVKNKIEGYKTDRGRIYIRYGKPLSIQRKFNSLNFPIEIWNYGNRNYIFVDENNSLNYKLMGIK